MEYEIEFYSKSDPHNRAIMDIPDDMTTDEVKVISDLQREAGRTAFKIRSGFPVYCPACGIRTGLSAIPDNHMFCRTYAANMLSLEYDKALKLIRLRRAVSSLD